MTRSDTHSIRFSDREWEAMRKMAEKEGRSVSNWAKWTIQKALKSS